MKTSASFADWTITFSASSRANFLAAGGGERVEEQWVEAAGPGLSARQVFNLL